jgi:1-deoxy-D-xylulose-5-phosphate reductoisomerase
MPAVLNAANEVAVAAFLENRIGFGDIPQVIESVMQQHQARPVEGLDQVLRVDGWARQRTQQIMGPRTIPVDIP